MRLVLIALLLLAASGSTQPRPRFERILMEEHEGGVMFVVIHDKETGQEVACYQRPVDLGYAPACWPTGRSWK